MPEHFEYAVLVIGDVRHQPPRIEDGERRLWIEMFEAADGIACRTGGHFVTALNRVGADGWAEYRREWIGAGSASASRWNQEARARAGELGLSGTVTLVSYWEFWLRRSV